MRERRLREMEWRIVEADHFRAKRSSNYLTIDEAFEQFLRENRGIEYKHFLFEKKWTIEFSFFSGAEKSDVSFLGTIPIDGRTPVVSSVPGMINHYDSFFLYVWFSDM